MYTVLSWASSISKCNRYVHAARQSVLLSADLMIMVQTVMLALQTSRRIREARLWAVGVLLCLLAPWAVYLFAAFTEEARAAPVLGTKCYRVFPLEDWFNPSIRTVAFIISAIAVVSALKQQNSSDIGAGENRLPSCLAETYIYVMAGLAMLNWLIQIALGFAQPHGEGGRFLIFVTAVLYSFYPIVQCLMLSLRTLVLERWRSIVRSYCPRRRRGLLQEAVSEEEGAQTDSPSLSPVASQMELMASREPAFLP
eukprot:TRINITY_DN50742_c0_g2_i1.p1 TRINITY_DN50742_c0_g2~~TRINITY_DN50742_c0_g2_i1.p1  ORF type:complete len:254 (-),score=25.70 TRINITY_DN50742_c0_g2_i1:96-857(-)